VVGKAIKLNKVALFIAYGHVSYFFGLKVERIVLCIPS